MAGRPTKQGLDYFPFDVDFFNDEKVEFVSARFGTKGEIVIVRLMCKIYRIGYYTEWNDDESTLLAKRAGDTITPTLVSDVVKELVKRGFFDKSILNRFNVLTSRGIQKRYVTATAERKEVMINSDYWLVEWPKNAPSTNLSPINSISPPINPINRPDNTQSKVKERKEKKSISSVACATEDREMIFEIFFFKNFVNPQHEVERFYSHYSATGWMRCGQPIVDRAALAESWTPEAKGRHRFSLEFLTMWRLFYADCKADPAATVLLRDIMSAEITPTCVIITSKSREMPDYIERNRDKFKPLLQESIPDRGLKYKVVK